MKPIPNDEDRLWEQHFFREEPDADFTLEVMRKLEGVSMESAEDGDPFTKKASKSHWMRRTGIAAAAVVILVGGAWFAFDHTAKSTQSTVNAVNNPPLPNIPVPEELKYSYFADDYKRLKPLGLVVNPNINIEDQGYTLKIRDVLVDRSQIVITLKQTTPDGLGLFAISPEAGRIHITDDQGRQVATLARDTRTSGSAAERLVFQLHDDIPDQVIVRGELGHLKVGSYYNFETKSYEDKNAVIDWSFQFNIDMTKAKSLAVEAPMNNTYTTPEGLKLDMTQLVRTPNGTRLDMNISLDDQLRAKVGEDWADDMDLMYHIEIPETNEYRIFNGSRPDARQAKFRFRDLSGLMDGGPLKLSETWDPAFVTVDAKKIRFVLEGYTIPVWGEKSVEVDLEKMRKDAEIYTYVLQFEQYGDEILFSDFNFKPVWESYDKNYSLVLEGSGTFRNAFNGDRWVAVDPEGKEYPVQVIGYPDQPNNDGEYVADNLKLVIRGFYKEDGTKLTLKRTVVNREYRDVNWEVDLPSYTSLPWQK
ncbi:DUF4179 domain-containing protein [Paenibacillus taichungensis]|uniref:DUF4179 domain-containing protein n=1 Tax=Paenibacillus taichungensis TaxID=484184 RepID=UPI002DBF97BF|nr:DUF4179 domain-containing protein [Paenibacillus taichungensis]MEC0106500.1 DUF4179 domain-containing protein [Paenibacillus taichungensis]MEC0198422.1 DUF4179 domain-containing protein [Paenibacillus taichungensis]